MSRVHGCTGATLCLLFYEEKWVVVQDETNIKESLDPRLHGNDGR